MRTLYKSNLQHLVALIGAVLFLGWSGAASAISGQPPTGAILDLAGTPISGSYQQYSVSFTGALSNTAITFAFRDDPAFISFSNPSLVDTTTSSSNLLTNSSFATWYTNNGNAYVPTGWTFANIYGASFYGQVNGGCGYQSGTNCWYDGSVGNYDGISQTVGTTIGDQYLLSFWAYENNGYPINYSQDNIDLLAYAQGGLPPAAGVGVPEPSGWGLFLIGLGGIGLGLFLSRKRMLPTV